MAEQWTAQRIKKEAPRYLGKPENFKPAKFFKRERAVDRTKSNDSKEATLKRETKTEAQTQRTLPKPTLLHTNVTPTPQKNDSLLSEAIFGPDVLVIPIEPRQTFASCFAALPTIAREMYLEYAKDVTQIDRKMVKEEMSYYLTALLWLRLIDIKSKIGMNSLSREEKTLLKDTKEDTYNIPQPFYIYLNSIGSIVDKMGKRTYLNVPPLPIQQAGGFGGYHAAIINAETHVLFEEIPSLGIAGDMLMAVASAEDEPVQNFRIAVPELARVSPNLIGRYPLIGPRRPEIRQRLAGFDITPTTFGEYVPNTRFHRQYILDISDRLNEWETFKLEKVKIQALTSEGGTVQAVQSRPTTAEGEPNWLDRTVQNTSAEHESTATMGAAFVFRFQLWKEAEAGDTVLEENANWVCVESADAEHPFELPLAWVANRNSRRNLPDVLECERFRAIANRTDIVTQDVIRRMVKVTR